MASTAEAELGQLETRRGRRIRLGVVPQSAHRVTERLKGLFNSRTPFGRGMASHDLADQPLVGGADVFVGRVRSKT
jgi:hypothetical protein